MNTNFQLTSYVYDRLIDLIVIPQGYYEKASERYKTLGEWLHRENSQLAAYNPDIYPQGSFRLGTVIKPLNNADEYDLDIVCFLSLSKSSITQQKLKLLLGAEIKAYADTFPFKEEPQEKRRCWRLNYSDSINFHMDITPCIPDQDVIIKHLLSLGIPYNIANNTVAITDIYHPNYKIISDDWPLSNPRGFALWFEDRMRDSVKNRLNELFNSGLYRSIQDIPLFSWDTPLQKVIQILKRHRDVMFSQNPDLKPISIIITTLSARAYNGETNISEALSNIVDKISSYIRESKPRIPNPTNPDEDFADKWKSNKELESYFRLWHSQLLADIKIIQNCEQNSSDLVKLINDKFAVKLPTDFISKIENMKQKSGIITNPKKVIQIVTPTKPWGINGYDIR